MESIMKFVLTLIEFVLAFGVLIFLHELGHYLVCRWLKIEVEEFGFGLPPRLIKLFTFQGTVFSLNLLPFGAFVRPKGENDPDTTGGLASAKPWTKFRVAAAGPLMNLMVGIVLFSYLVTQSGIPSNPLRVEIYQVMEGRPAQIAGLQAGDLITHINNVEVTSIESMIALIKQHKGKDVTLIYEREGISREIVVKPLANVDEGELGVSINYQLHKVNWIQALPYGAMATYNQARMIFLLPGMLIRGEISSDMARPVGPVGIFQIYQQVREDDLEFSEAATGEGEPVQRGLLTLSLIAVLTVGLGIANLLPIPGLDGSHMLFAISEMILRKRIPPEFQLRLQTIGLLSLMALMLFITIQDIINPIQLP